MNAMRYGLVQIYRIINLKYWSFDNLIWFADYLINITNLKIKKFINIMIINIFRINLIF